MLGDENNNLENKDQGASTQDSINNNKSINGNVDNFDEWKKEEVDNTQKETAESTESVKQNVVDSATTTLDWKTNARILHTETQASLDLKTYEWYTKALSQLIFEIDWCTQTAKYRSWLNKSWKQTLKTAREKLKQYKDIIKDKKRMIEHEFNAKNRLNSQNPERAPLGVKISNAEIEELKRRRSERKGKIEYDIKQWQDGKSSNIAPWPNQSLEQIQSGNRVDQDHNNYDSRLNEALQDAAFLRIIDNNQDAARKILQWIANNSLSDQQIVIIQSNMPQLSPYFEQYWMTSQVHRCIQTRWWRYTQGVQNYWNIDWKTAYKIWWVNGWLNNTLIKAFPNAKPEHVSNFTNIAVAAGWIYAIYRIWKRFFGKNEQWKRNLLWKTALLASGYFVPQLLLWQDGYSLLWDILSWKADFAELRYRAWNSLRFLHNNSPEVYAQMAPWILWMSIFPQTYTVDNVRSLQQTFSDQNARQQRYSTTYTRLNEDNSALANEFRNTFNQNQYNEAEWNIFLAKLWITDKTGWNTIIFNEAAKTTDKKTSFELRMKSQWKTRNPAFKKEIDDYLKETWDFDPNNIPRNWFIDNNDAKYTMREEDILNKEKLNDKIENLPLSSQQKIQLKSALEEFYDRRTLESKPNPNDFYLKLENGLLILSSHSWQTCKIKLETKEIEWFGPWINFTNLADLIDTADLTNKILETQKWKVAVWLPAFEYKPERKWICFNNANNLRHDIITWNKSWMDTRVISTWWWWVTNKVDTLCNHPKEYASYLSNRRIEDNKIDINANLYPMVKKLSESWIVFTNENEIKELETWLEDIKEQKKFSVWTISWNPFKISRQFKEFDHKLVFIALNWEKEVLKEDISKKFPTIMMNKDKFLTYMNNPDNWMRWSVFN